MSLDGNEQSNRYTVIIFGPVSQRSSHCSIEVHSNARLHLVSFCDRCERYIYGPGKGLYSTHPSTEIDEAMCTCACVNDIDYETD